MNDAWAWWLFFVGLGVGVAVYWLLAGRIKRTEDDLAVDEQAAEAAWISATIEGGGGEAPGELVEQILELHRRYLAGDGPDLTPRTIPPSPPDRAPRADQAGEPSARHTPDQEGDSAGRETVEAHLVQPG